MQNKKRNKRASRPKCPWSLSQGSVRQTGGMPMQSKLGTFAEAASKLQHCSHLGIKYLPILSLAPSLLRVFLASLRPPERGKQHERRRLASALLSSRGWFGWRPKHERGEKRGARIGAGNVQPFRSCLVFSKKTAPCLVYKKRKRITGAAVHDKSAGRLPPRRPGCIRWGRESPRLKDRVRTRPA